MLYKFAFLMVFLGAVSTHLMGQIVLPGTYEDDYRRLSLAKADSNQWLAYYPAVELPGFSKESNFKWVDPMLIMSFNSHFMKGTNDGPVWKGKGLTSAFYAGFQWRKGIFHASFAPVLYHSQNKDLPLAPLTDGKDPLNYQFAIQGSIDYVQRYGTSSFWRFHPGQTDLSLNFKHVAFGASTQNFTLGPARFNHLMMSNSGAGFPHAYLRTTEKLDLKIKNADLGKLEAFVFAGLLDESDHFDENGDNDRRYISGASVGYEIPYVKGLTVGFIKALYKDTQFFEASDLYSLIYIKDDGVVTNDRGDTTRTTGNDFFDQMATAFLEWRLPQVGARFYFEFGRGDFNGSPRRFISEFEHSRVYNAGFEKVWKLKNDNSLHLSYEHLYLPRYQSFRYRPNPPFYLHGVNRQGYTHDGQLLGAGVGPGAVSDIININFFRKSEIFGLMMQRLRYDEDYFISQIEDTKAKLFRHDVEFTLGLKYVRKSDRLVWGADLALNDRINMHFIKDNDEDNIHGNVFIRYLLNK